MPVENNQRETTSISSRAMDSGFSNAGKGMDIARPDVKKRKQRRRVIAIVAGVAALVVITILLGRLKPAAPSVDRGTVIIDTVKRGEMLRQIRGNGTLVPEQLLYVQSESEGRVERIVILPGAQVKADTLLIEMSNPELTQEAFDMRWQVAAAEAQLRKLKVQLESDRLSLESTLDRLRAELIQDRLEAEADTVLARDGLVPELTRKRSTSKAEQTERLIRMEEKRLAISSDSTEAQLAVQQAEIEKLRASLELKRRKVNSLKVVAGVEGVLQQIGDREMLQVGQRVGPGATLAKIVQPSQLKAEIKIPETQAKDIELGQRAEIDTRNGIVPGRVTRIDPAAVQGTVTVDVRLEGALPRGARPDLSVDGTIELERLKDVLHVGRPLNSQPEGTAGIFKVVDGGREAVRVPVKFGRNSVGSIVIQEGLNEGDQIITTDMSQWDSHDRVRLR